MKKKLYLIFWGFCLVTILFSLAYFLRKTRQTAIVHQQELELYISPNADGRQDKIDISYQVEANSLINVYIKDSSGKIRRHLLRNKFVKNGKGRVEFDGRDDRGLSLEQGRYFYVVTARKFGRVSNLDPDVIVDTNPPSITNISDTPDPFSPNSDTIKDTTTLSYTLVEDQSPQCWVDINIYSGSCSGTLVKTLIGYAPPYGSNPPYGSMRSCSVAGTANQETWNGTNDAGATVSDGTYTYCIDAFDLAGNQATQQSGTVGTDITAPVISGVSDSPDPVSPNADGINDTTNISYTISENCTVTIVIKDGSGTTVKTLVNAASRSSGANQETWDGKNDAGAVVSDGTYTYYIDASDNGGTPATQKNGTVQVITIQRFQREKWQELY